MTVAADVHILMTGGIFLQLFVPLCSVLLTFNSVRDDVSACDGCFFIILLFFDGKAAAELEKFQIIVSSFFFFKPEKYRNDSMFLILNPILITFVSKIKI